MVWDFIDNNGKVHNLEAETAEIADGYAQDWWKNKVLSITSPRNGQIFTDIGWLVESDDDGIEIRRIECGLEYEHYHGDKKEHGTW